MPRPIRRVRLVHANVKRSYEGASNGGWTNTISNKKFGDWHAIAVDGSGISLSCHMPECGGRLTVRLNTAQERAAFLRNTRIRRAKWLGVSAGFIAGAAFLQWITGGEGALLVVWAVISCVSSLTFFALLLMLVFGGRMPRYDTTSTSDGPSGVTHLVETAP